MRSLCGISSSFPELSPSYRQITHALLTRPPLKYKFASFLYTSVRLACVRHAASVHPEPGSNSPKIFRWTIASPKYQFDWLSVDWLISINYLVFALTIPYPVLLDPAQPLSCRNNTTIHLPPCQGLIWLYCKILGSAAVTVITMFLLIKTKGRIPGSCDITPKR